MFKSPDTDIFREQNAAEKSKVSKILSAVIFKGKTVKEQSCLILKTKTLQNVEQFSSQKHTFKSPDTGLSGEPNDAEKSKVSKSLSAVIFKGKTVREQSCLILKTKTLQNFEQFSSQKHTFKSPDTGLSGEPNGAGKSKVSNSLSVVIFKGKTDNNAA